MQGIKCCLFWSFWSCIQWVPLSLWIHKGIAFRNTIMESFLVFSRTGAKSRSWKVFISETFLGESNWAWYDLFYIFFASVPYCFYSLVHIHNFSSSGLKFLFVIQNSPWNININISVWETDLSALESFFPSHHLSVFLNQ